MSKIEVDMNNETIKTHKVITIKTDIMLTLRGKGS